MPSLENVRRIIGRGIIQKYTTDDYEDDIARIMDVLGNSNVVELEDGFIIDGIKYIREDGAKK